MAPLSAEVYKNQVAATKQEVILGLQMFWVFYFYFSLFLLTEVYKNQVTASATKQEKIAFCLSLCAVQFVSILHPRPPPQPHSLSLLCVLIKSASTRLLSTIKHKVT